MRPRFSKALSDDLIEAMEWALQTRGLVNIPLIAEQVRKRNESENVALEDIAGELLLRAQLRSAPMEFDAPFYKGGASSNPENIVVISDK